jgi:5-methyltetrahydropteroyltriglutamate--homocysteine methyltransferase
VTGSQKIYRADHVGSLLRPREILDLRHDPRATPDQLTAAEDRCILDVLDRQKALGFRIFTDGELRRRGFMSDFYEAIDGLDNDGSIARAWKGGETEAAGSLTPLTGLVVDRITQRRRLAAHEAAFLLRHCPGDVKMTLPSANQFPAIAYRKGISDRAYASYSEFLWDVVPIIRREIQALVGEGVKYVQIDAPRYSYFVDPKWRAWVKEQMDVEPEHALQEAIRVDNACLEGVRRDGVTIAIHLCRGNNRSQWYAEGGYDPIAEALFSELDVDLFLLEYDSERAGTFEPLRFVPQSKGVALGLISSKSAEMEPEGTIRRRIEDAARFVPLERLALSPQCGFASALEGNLLTPDDQWRKLQLVVETARKVWGES